MIIKCYADLRILSKFPKVSKDGKTYFHLLVTGLNDSEYADIGCTADVFNEAIIGKAYNCGFDINPFYLRKDYSTSININALFECLGDKSKKG